MNIAQITGVAVSLAGSSTAQSAGSVSQARQDARERERVQTADDQAAAALDLGTTDGEDTPTSDRDADGRRVWEIENKKRSTTQTAIVDDSPRTRDVTGEIGGGLDLSG